MAISGVEILERELDQLNLGIDVIALRERAYELKAQGKWTLSDLMSEPDGNKILRDLREYAQTLYVSGNPLIGAHLLRIPLTLGNGYEKKEWIIRQLSEIHANGYLSPREANRRHCFVYKTAKRVFGSWARAMEAWKAGSYKESVERFRRGDHLAGLFDENHELEWLTSRLLEIQREEKDISCTNLRACHRPEFNTIKALMSKGEETSYESFLESLGLKDDTKTTKDELIREGVIGELFTLVYLHALRLEGEIYNLIPYDEVRKKQEITGQRGVVRPDFLVQFPNSGEWVIVEVKSGFYNFTPKDLRNKNKNGIFDKYLDNKFVDRHINLNDARLHSLHLHFPSSRIHADALRILNEKGIHVITDEEFSRELRRFEDKVGKDVLESYQEFVRAPFVFVRDPEQGVIKMLEARVKELVSDLPF